MLINGDKLNHKQREQVLAVFIYRWTTDNQNRTALTRLGNIRIPKVTDNQWLREHAFHFLADGSRLTFNRRYAEPAYLATS